MSAYLRDAQRTHNHLVDVAVSEGTKFLKLNPGLRFEFNINGRSELYELPTEENAKKLFATIKSLVHIGFNSNFNQIFNRLRFEAMQMDRTIMQYKRGDGFILEITAVEPK